MRFDRTRDPEVFARRLAELAGTSAQTVHVGELVRDGRWLVCAQLDLGPRRRLLLESTAGHRLAADSADPAEAWPTHAAALAEVRDAVRMVRAGAADGGLRCVVKLKVTAAVVAERPASAALATAAGRRLGAVLAWCGLEAA